MNKTHARVDRLYGVMVEILNQPKTIDVMKKMPAYVKDGEVYDFNDRSFGETDKPDGDIFKGVARVKATQSVTAALKRDYTAALKLWLDCDEDADEAEIAPTKSPKGKKKALAKAAAKAAAAKEADIEEPEVNDWNLVKDVKQLLKAGDLKGAKKLLKANKEDVDFKKAKKLYKVATE